MVRVKSIKYIGREDVYNLEVEDHHNFSVNGGLIIHNCDSIRYGVMSRPRPNEVYIGFETKHWTSDMWSDYNRADKASKIILLQKWGKRQ